MIRNLIRTCLGRTASRECRSDAVISVGEILYTSRAEELSLPTFRESLRTRVVKEEQIEFAAASVLERVALAALVVRYQPQAIFEIGTFRGVTALTMAKNAPRGAVLYTLDLPAELTATEVAQRYYTDNASSGFHRMSAAGVARRVGLVLEGYQGPCRLQQLFGDSQAYDFTSYFDRIQLFFVDGCHEYEQAKKDTLTAWRCVSPGGLVVWHDHNRAPVRQAIQDAGLGVPVTFIRDTSLAFVEKPILSV